MELTILVIKYAIFALISIAVNIGMQEISGIIYNGKFSVAISMIFGTVVGLALKYYLDKKYIFKYVVKNTNHNTQKFFLYSLMGIFTTVIFWSMELSFNHIFETTNMRYLGGIIGLVIGYCIKYQLDKRFVFNDIKI